MFLREEKAGPAHRRPASVVGAGVGKIVIYGKARFFLKKPEVVETFVDWLKEVDRILHPSRNNEPWLKIVSNEGGKSGAEVRVAAGSVICVARKSGA